MASPPPPEWISAIPTAQLLARTTWEGLNSTLKGELFFARQADILGVSCPKVQLGYFYYESLQSLLRGARAGARIEKGETVCAMPVQKMLSSYTVTNSSLAPLVTMLDPDASHAKLRPRRASFDGRSLLAMLILRERAREISELMPYYQIVSTHDVSNVPMTFPPGSAKYERLSDLAKRKARHARTSAIKEYTALQSAFERFAVPLSEGIKCRGGPHTGAVGGGSIACPMEQLSTLYSEQQFLEVYAIVRARDWVLPMYHRDNYMMVPIIDMLNYGQVGLRVSFDNKRHAFVMVATDAVEAGKELLFFYGTFCKESMIDLYGFAVSYARPCPGGLTKPKGTYTKATG